MENLEVLKKNKIDKYFWRNKKILITGCKGFKGSWMIIFLNLIGCKIYGLDKKIGSNEFFFNEINLKKKIKYFDVDISNKKKISYVIKKIKPDICFHFAAQSLVLQSYREPIETFESNINGTIYLAQELSKKKKKTIFIISTTDKVYENQNKKYYNELDRLGGKDPYSISKVCVEALVRYYQSLSKNFRISTVRAGNIIGFGDWSKNRLIPDIYRNRSKIRNKHHVRPWQHVLEAIYGYVILAQKIDKKRSFATNYNFAPNKQNQVSVIKIIKKLKKISDFKYSISTTKKKLEQKYLFLDNSKSKKKLGLFPRWNIDKTLEKTSLGYKKNLKGNSLYIKSVEIIEEYLRSYNGTS